MKEFMENRFEKYYKKSRNERIEILKEYGISNESYNSLIQTEVLSNDVACAMIENQLSILGIPLAVATNFCINNKKYVIPMAVEEPSVIAAASNAAKKLGNIEAFCDKRITIGQIALYDVKENISILENKKEELLQLANSTQEMLVNLGGGAKDIKVEKKGDFSIVYLYVDTLDAMGANTINTMLEAIAPVVKDLLKAKKLMSILSNYATQSLAKAKCKVKLDEEIMDKIQKAFEFANTDVYRAVTNNKGILNGIDALALATGNDWRAIEAGAHAYAAKDGVYKSLSKWYKKDGYLIGQLELPMPIASFGGSIGLNPASKISFDILGNVKAKELSKIAVALGLAQNFAALYALVTSGIQKGHMKLQANSVALFAGANEKELDIVVKKMIEVNKININTAKKILEEIRCKL